MPRTITWTLRLRGLVSTDGWTRAACPLTPNCCSAFLPQPPMTKGTRS
jgi:hypothetical protein